MARDMLGVRSLILGISFCVAGEAIRAQAGPAVISGLIKNNALSIPSVPGTGVYSIDMARLPGDPEGTYTVSLSIQNLPPSDGGKGGGSDILTGKYNELTGAFTKDLLGAALNTTTHETRFVFERTGLIGVLTGWSGQNLWLSVRSTVTAPWPAPTPEVAT